jgi:hypothetical protein
MPRAEEAWGSGDFGTDWGSGGTAEPTLTGVYKNGANGAKPQGDPWTTSW